MLGSGLGENSVKLDYGQKLFVVLFVCFYISYFACLLFVVCYYVVYGVCRLFLIFLFFDWITVESACEACSFTAVSVLRSAGMGGRQLERRHKYIGEKKTGPPRSRCPVWPVRREEGERVRSPRALLGAAGRENARVILS